MLLILNIFLSEKAQLLESCSSPCVNSHILSRAEWHSSLCEL